MGAQQPSPGQPGQPGQGPPEQGPPGQPGGPQSRVEYYKELIDPKVTAVAGVGAWVGAMVLSFFVVTFLNLEDELFGDVSAIDLAHWMLVGGIGGGFENEAGEAFSVLQIYGQLDTNWWGAGIALHYLIPAIVLMIAGYALASHFRGSQQDPNAIDTVVVGASLAVPFVIMVLLGSFIFTEEGLSYDFVSVLLMGLAYPIVFASIGAAMKSSASVTSINGLIFGTGTFVLGLALWYFIEDPFEDSPLDGWGDLDGSTEQFNFLASYLDDHALEAGEFFPEWYVLIAALVGGVALAYYLEVSDPLAGMGKGAHVGVGYFVLVTLIALAATLTRVSDALDLETSWPPAVIAEINSLFGMLPGRILLAGVVYPVIFAAIGGALGAKIYESQSGTADASAGTSPPPQQGSAPPQQGQPPQGQQPQEQPPQKGQPPQQGDSSPPPAQGKAPEPRD